MKKITIPNTELEISAMGLGTVDAGVRWGKEASEADSMYGTFFDLGGNLIDCAHVYADWQVVDGRQETARAERVTGDWLQRTGNRDKIVLMTKGGHPVYTHPAMDLHINRCTKADMRGDLEGSLRILRTDYIDIYFYHRDDPRIPVEDMVETMMDFVREGKIRYFTLSNWSAERQKAADAYCAKMGYRGSVADQALLNLGSKYMNPLEDDTLVYVKGDLYDYHRENRNSMMMPYMGNASGFFHIYCAKGEEAVKGHPYATEKNLAMAARIPELTKKYDCAVTNIVLGYFTQEAFPCVPLYGPMNEASIVEAAKTFDIAFDNEDYVF
ncbi:MAG: aldo/keto reductase [Lachnospiraceae bacterium]|nr:aldo/keto reductase [Lachnospiraceae bacterium]